jgi:acetyltransferase-like isoleucine patch superfamily enzyme
MLSRIISGLKGESFVLDRNIPNLYLLRFLLEKLLACIKFVIVFRIFKLGFVGARSKVLASNHIVFKRNLSIADDCHVDALSIDGIQFGSNVSIQKRVIIECSGSLKHLGRGLVVGDNVGIGSNSFLGCAGGIEIGDDTIIGNFVSFHSENHRFDRDDLPIRLQGVSRKGVKIGKNCWIGAKATILDGTHLGDGCIVAAGAVLNGKTYPKGAIIGGVPAKVLKLRCTQI